MRRTSALLAGLVCASRGYGAYEESERLEGCSHEERWLLRSSQSAGDKRLTSLPSNRKHVVAEILKPLAVLFLAYRSPTAVWHTRGCERQLVSEFGASANHRNRHVVACAQDDRPNMQVRWVPVDTSLGDAKAQEDAMIMPVFPLSSTHLPNSEHKLNILEPRYRAMYDDIIFSGSRRFVVCNVDEETGRLAEVGVIFYLEDLKEVSEQTQNQVKYVGLHSVHGRVKVLRVLNPSAAATRETYLRAEVEEFEDDAADEHTTSLEATVLELFTHLVEIQGLMDEEPRFTVAVKSRLALGPSTPSENTGLWSTLLIWQKFLKHRAENNYYKCQAEVESAVLKFLIESKADLGSEAGRTVLSDVPSRELPDQLEQEIRGIQRRYSEDFDIMELNPYGLQFQAILQSHSHAERLSIFRYLLEKELLRLQAKASVEAILKK